MKLRVRRSRIRYLLAGGAGVLLVLAALDVLWFHVAADPPTTSVITTTTVEGDPAPATTAEPETVYTTRGLAERRADLLWGIPLLIAGGALVFGAAALTAGARPVAAVTDAGLELRLGPPGSAPVRLPWDRIYEIRTGWFEEEDGGGRAMVVRVVGKAGLPLEPWGARWHGAELWIDAEAWIPAVEEVADLAGVLEERHRTEPPVHG